MEITTMAAYVQYLLLFLFLDLSTSQIVFPGANRESPRPSMGGNGNTGGGTLVLGGGATGSTSGSTGQFQRNACNCFDPNSCPRDKGQAKHGCLTEQNRNGICCIPQEDATTVRHSFGSARPISIPENMITAGFASGVKIVNNIYEQNAQRKRAGQFLKPHTAPRSHAYFFQRSPTAADIHKQALLNARASVEISKMQKLSPEQAHVSLNGISMSDRLRRPCPMNRNPRCNPLDKFRTIDGTCNNLVKPLLGSSETIFARLAPPHYEDGIMSPREFAVSGRRLPLVRDVSNIVLLDVNNPSSDLSLAVMQWGQFIDHDLTLAEFPDMEGEAIECCQNGRPVPNQPEECFNIPIASDDGFFSLFRQRCINFVRSLLGLRDGCSFGPAEQLNSLTHYLDGSMVYGSNAASSLAVLEGPNSPFLATSRGQLPPLDPEIDCEANDRADCFVAGDSRVSEHAALTVMHTVFIREHNRIVRELQHINPHWSPERLFQEARRIVIAQIQHITYEEWLPLIVGRAAYDKHRLGAGNSYNPSVDPSQLNEFATAAFRFGHSLVQGIFLLPSSTGRITTMRLRDLFNRPGVLQNNPELVNSFIRGLTTQNMQTLDNFITEELSNHLFETGNENFGMDLMSLNLQRGRDHGIPNYTTLRRLAGVGAANNFIDLRSTTEDSLIARLQASYENSEDIDIFVGGMTERRVAGGVLGQTFAEIVAQQFSNIKRGDRFFYDVTNQEGSLTRGQIREIQKSSLSKLFCDNSDVVAIQPKAFVLANRQDNPTQSCEPGVNVGLWRD